MYNMNKDTYTCDTCSFENAWDASDEVHGELWGCDRCGNTFCSKCFIDRYGMARYMSMMQESSEVYCPSCYKDIKMVTYKRVTA